MLRFIGTVPSYARVIITACLLMLISATSSVARPVDVVIFPSGAIVTEEATLKVINGQVEFLIPNTADPETLRIMFEDNTELLNFVVEQTTADKLNLDSFRDKIKVLKTKLQTLQSLKDAKMFVLDFWKTQQQQKFSTPAETIELSQAIEQKVPVFLAELSAVSEKLSAGAEALRELEKKFSKFSRHRDIFWKITADLENCVEPTVSAQYSYKTSAVSWISEYRIDAKPFDNKVNITWFGRITQSTGVDWTNVDMHLVTQEPIFTLTPPELRPWVFQPRPPMVVQRIHAKVSRSFSAAAESMAKSNAVPQKKRAPSPKRNIGATFDTYDLGKKSIVAGTSPRFPILAQNFEMDFIYLIRPAMSDQAFLQASAVLPKFQVLPTGSAILSIDGLVVGKRMFSLHEPALDIAFGTDTAIKVEVNAAKKTSLSGLINKDITQVWSWTVQVTNNKTWAVSVLIEDVIPSSTHSDIVIKAPTSTLRRAEATASISDLQRNKQWTFNLVPKASRTLSYSERVLYPEKMNIDLGR